MFYFKLSQRFYLHWYERIINSAKVIRISAVLMLLMSVIAVYNICGFAVKSAEETNMTELEWN